MRDDVLRFAGMAGQAAEPISVSIPWDRSRDACGVLFPADYREFIDRFGPGEVRGYLHVGAPWPWRSQPGSEAVFRTFTSMTTDDLGPAFRTMREEDQALCPYPFLPEPGGLLHWGGTVQGDQFFWLTGDPDPMEWPVVVWFRGKDLRQAWRRYEMRFVAFLLHALSGQDPDMHELLDWPEQPVWTPAESNDDVE